MKDEASKSQVILSAGKSAVIKEEPAPLAPDKRDTVSLSERVQGNYDIALVRSKVKDFI